jgi:ribose 5-phosphate isomerase B
VGNNEIWIGSDHDGYELKVKIMEYLLKKGIPCKDIGCHSEKIVWYPHFAAIVAGAVSKNIIRRGILICSTGIGMSTIANKLRGVRASLCSSTYMGKMSRAHNNSNILCLGGKITGVNEALDILKAWLTTEFEGGRHCISLDLIEEAENAICNSERWNPEILNI